MTPFHFPSERRERAVTTPAGQILFVEDRLVDRGVGPVIRRVFSHFQNLNLRVLIEDLRRGRVTQGDWRFEQDLCPVAHGLADGCTVAGLRYLSQAKDLRRACDLAAQQIGAPPNAIHRLVLTWDAGDLGPAWLLTELEAIWRERLADAEVVQAM